MSEIEFSTLAAKLRICLIFTGRHSQEAVRVRTDKANFGPIVQILHLFGLIRFLLYIF